MLKREEALSLIKKHITKKNWFLHMLAVEAIMRRLAEYLGEDQELWGLVGLIHDLDFEEVGGDMKRHGIVSTEILEGRIPEEVIHAIKAHNFEFTGIDPVTKLDKALIAADAISGLVIACALVMPSKKLSEVRVKSIRKKFKESSFARGVDRKSIMLCEDLGIERDTFFQLALEALQSIHEELGL